jgi:hypothetical protein
MLGNSWVAEQLDASQEGLSYMELVIAITWIWQEAASRLNTEDVPSILWNPMTHSRVHNNPPLAPILSQMSPVHTLPILSLHLHWDLPNEILTFRISYPNILVVYRVSHSCYIPCMCGWKCAYKCLVGKPLSRCRHSWKNIIKMGRKEFVDLIHLPQDRDRC